jgi:multisubunit Na+/H+ antiporter MnhG subunit
MDKKEENKINEEIKKENDFEVWYAIGLVSKLGFSIALIVAIFLWVGHYLDQLMGTKVLFSAVFLLLSVPVSIYDIYYLLEPIVGSEKKKDFLKKLKRKK